MNKTNRKQVLCQKLHSPSSRFLGSQGQGHKFTTPDVICSHRYHTIGTYMSDMKSVQTDMSKLVVILKLWSDRWTNQNTVLLHQTLFFICGEKRGGAYKGGVKLSNVFVSQRQQCLHTNPKFLSSVGSSFSPVQFRTIKDNCSPVLFLWYKQDMKKHENMRRKTKPLLSNYIKSAMKYNKGVKNNHTNRCNRVTKKCQHNIGEIPYL